MGGHNFVTIGPVPDAQNDQLFTASLNVSALATIVPPVANKRIFVFGYLVAPQSASSLSYAWQDMTAAGATVAAPMGTLAIGLGGHDWPFQAGYPLFTIASGDALAINPSAPIGGRVFYQQG